MRQVARRAGVAIVVCIALGLLFGVTRAKEGVKVNQQYVIYGSYSVPSDEVFRSDGTVRDSVIYYLVDGTIDTVDMPDTLAAGGTRLDSVDLAAIRTPHFRVCVQYKTRGRETGVDSPLVVKVRPLDVGHVSSYHSQVLDEEYYIDPDSTRSGWWGGCLVFRRTAFWRWAEISITNDDTTPVDSLFPLFDSVPVGQGW